MSLPDHSYDQAHCYLKGFIDGFNERDSSGSFGFKVSSSSIRVFSRYCPIHLFTCLNLQVPSRVVDGVFVADSDSPCPSHKQRGNSVPHGMRPHELIGDKLVLPNGLPGMRLQLADLLSIHPDMTAIFALGCSLKALGMFENLYPEVLHLRKFDADVATTIPTHMDLRSRSVVVEGPLPATPDREYHIIVVSFLLGGIAIPGRLKTPLLDYLLGRFENMMTPGSGAERILLDHGYVKPIAIGLVCDAFDHIDAWPHLIFFYVGPFIRFKLIPGQRDPESECLLERHGFQLDEEAFHSSPIIRGLGPSLAQNGAKHAIIMDTRVSFLSPEGRIIWTRSRSNKDALTGERLFIRSKTWGMQRLFQTLAFIAHRREQGDSELEAILQLERFRPAGNSTIYFTEDDTGRVGKTHGIAPMSLLEQSLRHDLRFGTEGRDPAEVTSEDVIDQEALFYPHNSKNGAGRIMSSDFRLGQSTRNHMRPSIFEEVQTASTMHAHCVKMLDALKKLLNQVMLFFPSSL